ncbi:MAG: ABC transporter substrate-binding protein [Oscillospiraceae bacterium]|jgi:ABC-type glycerol-3-phosphate transport system substrate-binding protein|nr:ABC transporter substrate-binding protein [Oscillospiraceae bacterium]
MKLKQLLALCLTCACLLTLFACGDAASPQSDAIGSTAPTSATPKPSTAHYTEDGKRIITIGTWGTLADVFYVSKHTDIYDDTSLPTLDADYPDDDEGQAARTDAERRINIAQMRLNKIREIEEKYNVVIELVNLTFAGIQESIRTSIPEGIPDVDIYQVDSQFGIPAVLSGYGVALEDIGLAETDVFNKQAVTKNLQLAGQDKSYLFNQSQNGGLTARPLAFNLTMIEAAGLENPQDLYDRGEWTWEAWEEYLKVLTVDTDDDGTPNVYGYGGYWTDLLRNLLKSNGAGIATGETQTLDSKETREVFDYIHKIYTADKTARPWDGANWEINNKLYAEGVLAFWIGADWIFNEQGYTGLPFEIGVVPWPCGPSGKPETNYASDSDSTWYMIPQGAEDPEFIYNVIFDWLNWYDYDLDIAVDYSWARERYMSERNFEYAQEMSAKQGFDLWESLSKTTNFSLVFLMQGSQDTQALIDQYAESYQAALDTYFAK